MKQYPISEVIELAETIQSQTANTPGRYSPDACLRMATIMVLDGQTSAPVLFPPVTAASPVTELPAEEPPLPTTLGARL